MLNNNVLNDLVMSTRKSCKFGGEKALVHVASLMNQYSFIITVKYTFRIRYMMFVFPLVFSIHSNSQSCILVNLSLKPENVRKKINFGSKLLNL